MISEKFDGKSLYCVNIRKSGEDRVWVLAHNEQEALFDAHEMLFELEFLNTEYDFTPYIAEAPMTRGEIIWSGGADGKEIEFSDL